MDNYLNDVKYALQSLIVLVWKERDELLKLQKRKSELQQKIIENNKLTNFLIQNPDLDDEGLGNFTYWLNRHEHVPDFNEIEKSILNLHDGIKNKQYSIDLLSSSILQIAKQGIIKVFGNFESCPSGRIIKTLPLKEFIWYGRNQGIHFEEGSLNRNTDDFFSKLKGQIAYTFDNYKTRNMSFKY